MSQTDTASILRAYIEELPEPEGEGLGLPAPWEGLDPLVHELVVSMLLWNASAQQTAAAMGRLRSAVVDHNELRVLFSDEMTSLLGPRYPQVEERVYRIGLVLNAVFEHEHAMTLDTLKDMPKRDAKVYLDAVRGLPPFAASRVFLLGLGGHAFPVDERLALVLIEDEAVEPDLDAQGIAARLERALRAGEAEPAYARLEAYVATRTGKQPRKKKTAKSRGKRPSGKP